jgi:outer membrane receptor protein involved in Fe transport
MTRGRLLTLRQAGWSMRITELSMAIVTFVLGLLLVGIPPETLSQVTTSSVTGFISDSSGAALTGVVVKIIEVRTGFTRSAMTNESGQYSILAIPAGEYDFTAEHPGFQRVERKGQAITQQIAARIDFVLALGAVQEKVSVTAAAPLLETETPANSLTIDSRKSTELPTLGHNYLQTAFLSPGVTSVASNSMLTITVSNYFSGGTDFKPVSVSILGGRPDFTAFFHDGVDVHDPMYGGDLFEPSPEAISSYRVVRGYDSSQFGGEPSIVYVSTKSGTNQYHGSVWEYHQDAALRARGFGATEVPALVYNQAGFTFGGPLLPQLKNKTFVFGEFQLTRTRAGQTGLYTVPTEAEWGGDLSAIPVQLYNPFETDSNGNRVPFLNNQIPANLLSPVSQKYKTFTPLPNVAGAAYGDVNYITNSPSITDDTQFLIRVDQVLPHFGTVFVKYFKDNVNSVAQGIIPDVGFGTPLKGQTASIEWDQPIGPHKLNTVRFGFYRSWVFFGGVPTSTDIMAELGFKNYNVGKQHWGFPALNVTGFGGIPSIGAYDTNNYTTRFGLQEDFSVIKGRHTINLGAVYQPSWYPVKNANYPRGSLNYGGDFTKPSPSSQVTPVAFADFLLGAYSSAWSDPTGFSPFLTTTYYSWYGQDKIQVNPKLSLSLGLRWDWWSPPVEKQNRWLAFDWKRGQLAYVLKNPADWTTDQTLSGQYPRGMFMNWKKKNFSPRIGLSYLLTPSTTIRAGGGIYYAQGLQNFQAFSSFGAGNPPFDNAIIVSNDPGATAPSRLDSTLFDYPPVGQLVQGSPLVTPDIYAPQPYLYQYTFSIQRQLGNNMLLTTGYNGTFGRHLNNGGSNINQASLLDPNNPLPYQQRVPYPFFDFIFLQSDNTNSSYNGMYLSFEKRYSHGLDLIASYTWSKSIDEYTSSAAGGNNQNALCIPCDRALSDNDRRHVFSLGYIWDLPVGPSHKFLNHGVAAHILGNWRVSGITIFQSGIPLTPTTSTPWINVSSWIALPRSDRICNGRLDHPTMDKYFDTSCFPAQPPNTFGNSGRNVVIGPGAQNWDMSLIREFPIRESLKLNLRGEFFSVFNHQNWGQPTMNVFSPSFGRIFGKSNARIIQIAAKLTF